MADESTPSPFTFRSESFGPVLPLVPLPVLMSFERVAAFVARISLFATTLLCLTATARLSDPYHDDFKYQAVSRAPWRASAVFFGYATTIWLTRTTLHHNTYGFSFIKLPSIPKTHC
ncbi:hypothetical protein B0H14DRAFT_2739122 [Mycena olivaceomarginata]|nr:hypothetical protein B0H14DRAFT_2944929 [Mycena olivaceomarginata]KAJ7863050.1 hypothetical protein B0H14DRAFT_2739122 [Mycena olivaceomarginata]